MSAAVTWYNADAEFAGVSKSSGRSTPSRAGSSNNNNNNKVRPRSAGPSPSSSSARNRSTYKEEQVKAVDTYSAVPVSPGTAVGGGLFSQREVKRDAVQPEVRQPITVANTKSEFQVNELVDARFNGEE